MKKNKMLVVLFFMVLFLSTSCSTFKKKQEDPNNYRTFNTVPSSNFKGDNKTSVKYIDHLESVIKKQPDNLSAYFELGGMYFKKRDLKRSAKIYEKIVNHKKAVWQEKAAACLRIAKIEELKKDYKKALKWYDKGVEIEGFKGTYVIGNKGLIFEKMNEYEKASEIYKHILRRQNLSSKEIKVFRERLEAIRFLKQLRRY
ncbi:MAG: tetratricopeptide repeat protein [Candidatus Aureabacteria bacterium]|nr:tetratricopeptide repeat protein [Candidatus Auribacterota bacterium]